MIDIDMKFLIQTAVEISVKVTTLFITTRKTNGLFIDLDMDNYTQSRTLLIVLKIENTIDLMDYNAYPFLWIVNGSALTTQMNINELLNAKVFNIRISSKYFSPNCKMQVL